MPSAISNLSMAGEISPGDAAELWWVPVSRPVLPLQQRSCQTLNTARKQMQGLRKKYQHRMVMILYLISCLCFCPTESWMFLCIQYMEKWDYKAVVPEMPVLMPSLRDTLHKSRRISMWCLLKVVVWGFDHWICCMLHVCWACMAPCRLLSTFEDFRKTKKSLQDFFTFSSQHLCVCHVPYYVNAHA